MVWIQLAPHLSDSQFEWLNMVVVDLSVLPQHHLQPATAAARQQRRHGAKMINNDWQALGVGLMDTRELARIITTNTARIDLPMWLQSEPCADGANVVFRH